MDFKHILFFLIGCFISYFFWIKRREHIYLKEINDYYLELIKKFGESSLGEYSDLNRKKLNYFIVELFILANKIYFFNANFRKNIEAANKWLNEQKEKYKNNDYKDLLFYIMDMQAAQFIFEEIEKTIDELNSTGN